ncbi:MAG: dethiobiotin synthase [Bacteroidota bacterium]
MSIIIAGIHTGIGKTICSAVICQGLGYDYWKPVQAGDLETSDSVFIKQHVTNINCTIHPEAYRLTAPVSPHDAAERDGLLIRPDHFKLPVTDNQLLVETAGGIMTPLAPGYLNIDLIEQLALPVILVAGTYLGSINHTLLSIAALQQRNILVNGIVFSGEMNAAGKNFILKHTGITNLFNIPHLPIVNRDIIHTATQVIQIKTTADD